MDAKSQRPKRRDATLSSLNSAIEAVNIAKDILNMTPATAALGTVSVILAAIRDSMINEEDYVDLGLACADVCRALDRGMNGRRMDEFSQSVLEAIGQLTTTVAEIQRNIVERAKRNAVTRLFHAKNDKETIATWRLDLNRILHVFNAELVINTHVVVSEIRNDVVNTHTIVSGVHQGVVDTHNIVSDIHRTVVKRQERIDGKNLLAQTSVLGELPPPPPRACFGRDHLIEKIVGLTENLAPTALIGTGGIGKTSVALAVLHNVRIKHRFGDNRRFIRCDQISASPTHFLSRLSKVVGAGVQNPEDLTPLRPFLSSKEILIVLDNAESILDPQGTNGQETYALVEELSRLETICLCITSRISTIPPDCETFDIPTLSMESARDTFYRIYKRCDRPDLVDSILERLDFHPLSITLLATVAHHNKWDTNRLTREWERRRTDVLCTQHNKSLAATIELSLTSPMFQELGPDARELLGAIAFFPQGVDENNLEWLFPTIPDGMSILDRFCILSLTYRSNGFVTMLAPLRDYLRPKDPKSSPLLCTTKEGYLSRLSVELDPNEPSFGDTRWITSEDVNVEHLLDAFASADPNSDGVWDACADFMRHLFWHKKRLVVLGPKIEGLPDDHRSKPECLVELSQLYRSVGNFVENKRLLIRTLELRRERGDGYLVAQTLIFLAYTNRQLHLYKEGILQAKESLEICKQLDHTIGQAHSFRSLAWLLHADNQLDDAEDAASRVVDLFTNIGDQFEVSNGYRILGIICHSRGKSEEAIKHFEAALGIASSFSWHGQLCWVSYAMAELFFDGGRFDDAHIWVERAKSYAADDDAYLLGRSVKLQAGFWHKQRRLEEAESEALQAVDLFEKLGASWDLEKSRELLWDIQKEMSDLVATNESNGDGEPARMASASTPGNPPISSRDPE